MQITKTLLVKSVKEWRGWLQKNYQKEKEIWLVFFKKGTGKATLSYNEAVEQALCFGWIDSQEKGINQESYALRFTPRNPKTPYSKTNQERLKRLIDEGLVLRSVLESLKNLN